MGDQPSCKDPVRYSFAFGGKDGVPFPVNRRAMDETIEIMKQGIDETILKREEILRSIEKLRKGVPHLREKL